jgi:hypothetical protein
MHTRVRHMIQLSTVLNIVVLIPVIIAIFLDPLQVQRTWGTNQPSRQILVSIYIAILIASTALLFLTSKTKIIVGVTVFSMQVVYKILTALLVVNAFTNPVVLSNLVITLVHLSTLYVVFKHEAIMFK